MSAPKEKIAAIFGQMVEVMKAIGAVGKEQRNTFDKYNFRGIDDVYNALGPAMQNAGIFVLPRVFSADWGEVATKNGGRQAHVKVGVNYYFVSGSDGSEVMVCAHGEGMDRGDKALNKAMSAAYKNAVFQTFAIPTNDKSDSENDSPEVAQNGNDKPQKGNGKPTKKPAQKKASGGPSDHAWDGKLDDVQIQKGSKGNKEWTRYGLRAGSLWISTFDTNDGEEALRCCDTGCRVGLTYSDDGKYKTLTSITSLEEPSDGEAEQNPPMDEPPPHDDSDVPF
jgi:hypothetical protein